MSSSERNKTPQPSQTMIEDIKEDVNIDVTHVQKVAVLSISYRVVDASSANVMFADSVIEKKKVADETTGGVKIGIYESKMKLADLQSDSELLAELTATLSQQIGDKVVGLLRDPEVDYQKDGLRLYDERKFVEATEEMAKALVMTESKGKPSDELAQWVREYAVTARLSAE